MSSLSSVERWRSSERIAARLLEQLGYHVIDSHRKIMINNTEVGEIDFVAQGPDGETYAVEVKAGKPIEVKIITKGPIPREVINGLKEDIFITVQLFEEQVRRSSFYFAWVEGEPVVLEKGPQKRRNIIYRLFSESMLMFFVIFIAISIFLFIIFGPYTPILLVALQFVIFLFSDKIIMRMGSWQITRDKPSVHIFHYHLPAEEYRDFRRRFNRDLLMRIKAEIYERTLAVGKAVDCKTANEVFSKYAVSYTHLTLPTN